MGNYTVKECPCEACKKTRAAEQKPVERAGYTDLRKLAKPPAGDVVEDFKSLYHRVETGEMLLNDFFIHAFAVAHEGYVSLEDVEKALRQEIKNGWGISADDTHTILWHVRARLAKPAEQTDEQKVEAILKHIWNAPVKYSDHLLREIAAEIVAALRDGRRQK